MQQLLNPTDAGLDDDLRERCAVAAADIAVRLTDAVLVGDCLRQCEASGSESFGWVPPSLGAGHAGLALALSDVSSLSASSVGDDLAAAALDNIRTVATLTRDAPVAGAGLFMGTSGIAYVLSRLTDRDERYAPVWEAVHSSLLGQRGEALPPRRPSGVSFLEYDVIDGAAGVLMYLLASGRRDAETVRLAHELVDYLLWLLEAPHEGHPPSWWTPAEAYITPRYAESFPSGLLNLGLSHGLPGVLLVLADALDLQYRGREMRSALLRWSDWLLARRTSDGWDWAVGVSPDQERYEEAEHRLAPTWCYGDMGVCVALAHVAAALGSAGLAAAVDDVVSECLRVGSQPASSDDGAAQTSPTVCHGEAGVLLMARHFAAGGHAQAAQYLVARTPHLLARYEPGLPLGVQDIDNAGRRLDDPGLLTGAAGVAQVLAGVSSAEGAGSFLPFLGAGAAR